MRTLRVLVTGLVVVLMAFSLETGTTWAAEYVRPPVSLEARKVLPAGLLAGTNYRINDAVRNDGMYNFFTLVTDYGAMNAESETVLNVRLNELRAMVMMQQMERKKVFGDALVEGVKAPFKGAAALVTSPLETGKAVIEGAGQFLSNVGQGIVSDDPSQDNALKVAVGYDVAKRKFAYEFDINPYTTNEPVAERLGEIARAAVAGGITPKVAMAAVDSTLMLGARIAGTAQSMKLLVRDNPPGKLREINGKKLKAMGVSDALAKAFLENYSFDPFEKTLLVGELESMKKVKGRDMFITRAGKVTTPKEAMLLRRQAQMMGGYHANVSKVSALVNVGGVLALQKKGGGLAVVLPTDLLFLTKDLERRIAAFDTKAGAGTSRELFVSGTLDKPVRDLMESRGWKVTEQAEKVLIRAK